MKNNVIPPSDSAFDAFQKNFITQISANSALWGFTPAMIAVLTALQMAWDSAWLAASNRFNRTSTQVAAKDLARQLYVAQLRPFIKYHIYGNPLMSNTDRIACGVRPHDTTRTPVPVPSTMPIISIGYNAANQLKIRFKQQPDASGSSLRGKPAGVSRCQIVYVIGTQPTSPAQCNNLQESGRSPITGNIDSAALRGQRLWYYARWVNTSNEYGPWTPLDSFLL
ncbi:MAG: hypothetical protein AB7G44_07995 [Bacteroidia bacterium]